MESHGRRRTVVYLHIFPRKQNGVIVHVVRATEARHLWQATKPLVTAREYDTVGPLRGVDHGVDIVKV